MLSHLRFHRRGPSNPTSPVPENNSPWDSVSLPAKHLIPEDGAVPTPEIRPRSDTSVPHAGQGKSQDHVHVHGTTSQLPPQPQQPPPPPPPPQQTAAPSLPPITRIISNESETSMNLGDNELRPRDENRPPSRTPYNAASGFIGGLALQNYRREQQDAMRPALSDKTSNYGRPNTSALHSPPGRPPARSYATTPSFISPTDLQNAGVTGKRPPGARVTSTEPQGPPVQNTAPEPARAKKSLPFLKNPMSTLLLRRKTSQNLPDLSLPLRTGRHEPSYQPIRGTRVHDFSAPRPRRIVSSNDVAAMSRDKPLPDTLPTPVEERESPGQPAPPVPPKDKQDQSLKASSSTHSGAISADASFHLTHESPSDMASIISRRELDGSRRKSSVPSSISTLSGNTSEVSNLDVLSSLPKHMKSTSSRFSFDMIGAAKAEKLLEDKHRQRQQDKKQETTVHRDSRFDDFDEDGFDYDAMDYDDGLEEAIPGVNCDYGEEEEFLVEEDTVTDEDPDNDQENFAGFVFQRSDSVSDLASPRSAGILPTPRDGDGNVIGYAMTKESPEAQRHSSASTAENPVYDGPTGLGIQGLDVAIEAQERLSVRSKPVDEAPSKHLDKDDELYFGGLGHEFEGEGDGTAIDESLFDLNDTDQYGRPLPGVFASALARQEANKRESDDVTSRLSAQSGLSQSTAHTSLSVGLHQNRPPAEALLEDKTSPDEPAPPLLDQAAKGQDNMAAYQAALAAAAHEAAASGKFRRDSSPPPPADLTITSPTTSGSEEDISNRVNDLAGYEDDDSLSNGLDDYELDDDAIIAEANASALANDSDGWYGQEFGFYSNPTAQSHHGSNSLSEQNLYQYASGGYFGPSGVTRTKSGHLISREPNLTPITERSEYSNRNSIMSLQMPNSGNRDAPLHSPGLAQLAMMADDDNMSLSALLRLRSKAWGGSQVSLASSREGSPGERNGTSSPWGQDSRDYLGVGPGHGRKNSAFSIWSQDSGAGSGSGSPTLTMSLAGIPSNAIPPLNVTSNSSSNSAPSPHPAASLYSPPPPPPHSASFLPVLEDEEADVEIASISSPTTWTTPPSATELMTPASPTVGMPSQRGPGMGHRHKGSADSISYIKEEEDSGETRWVLERRRTAESGETEILGREVVEGGRI
ncbi:hypothetical protein BJ170DRAFT_65064 [Xylariales sp. AK1849]|nr:hypothetical protein BJ170DRAFT_65064 [Xylariales sp. AK1849]